MRSRYWRFWVLIGFLMIGIVYFLTDVRMTEETIMPDSINDEHEKPRKVVIASNAEGWPKWWDEMLEAAVQEQQWSAAADYAFRKAGYYQSVGREEEAASWYSASDRYWEKDGHKDKRFYDETKPDPKAVTMSMYVSVPAAGGGRLAKYEPQSGAYLGMFGLNEWTTVENTFGRYHPIALTYAGWRKDENDRRNYFPTRTVDRVKAAGGGAIQIGWEPQYGLDAVQDDDYVRGFAREAKAAGIPVFLRYASEMNGQWVPWYDDPKKYVEKFRLISRIVKEEAPNAVMVWSPNFLPFDNIDAYYPGDDYVDWVGVSLYSTPFVGGQVEDLSSNQIDYFMPLYAKYSHKPMMISEGGVSHYYLKTNTNYAKWGEGQLGNMYGYLPRMFPRVKAVTYFNMSRQRAVSSKSDHVYDIKDNVLMYNLYRRLVQNDYFLTRVEQGLRTQENVQYIPLTNAPVLDGKHRLFTYIKLPLDIQPYSVAVYQGDRRLGISYEIPWEIEADFSSLEHDAPLTAIAYNGKHEVIAAQTFERKPGNR